MIKMNNLILIICFTIIIIIIYKVFKYNFDLIDNQDTLLKGYEHQQFDIETKERLIKVLESDNKRLFEENQNLKIIIEDLQIRNNDKSFERIDIEDNYRKLLLEKFTEVREYYEDEYSKKELGTAERVRFIGIVFGLYEAISIINQIDWRDKNV